MLFDSTLRKDLARTFGATLVVILTIVLTMMLIRTLGLAAGGKVSPQDVVLLLGYTALGHLPTILNLSLFIAVVATLGRMYRDSEMAIWFASGAGLSRFVRPVLRMSGPVLAVVVVLVFFVWPWGNRNSADLRDRYEKRSDLSRVAPGQFQTSSDGSKVFFIDRAREDPATGRNVFILSSTGPAEAVTSAKSGHLELQGDDRYLVLERGQRNDDNSTTGEKTLSRFETYRVVAGERVQTEMDDLPPKARPTLELLAHPNPKYQGELVWRIGLLLGGGNLLLLAVGLSATNPRRASNWSLLLALLAFIVYFNLINLSQSWVANGRLTMGSALLAVHGSAFVVALGLIWWRENGATRGLFRRPSRPTAPA
jgi:lipopolysaccharide export system permease protein